MDTLLNKKFGVYRPIARPTPETGLPSEKWQPDPVQSARLEIEAGFNIANETQQLSPTTNRIDTS
jgi:hypothetical protein